jgi:hypothetical protein
MTFRDTQGKRVLAIAFNVRGFGFAVFDGPTVLSDWGIKKVTAKESANALIRIEEKVSVYRPDVVVFEDLEFAPFRHSARIKGLHASLEKLIVKIGIGVKTISLFDVKKCLFDTGRGTKYEVAQKLATRFPEELGHLLPDKRLPWTTEHHRMGIFDAVALAVTYFEIESANDSDSSPTPDNSAVKSKGGVASN